MPRLFGPCAVTGLLLVCSGCGSAGTNGTQRVPGPHGTAGRASSAPTVAASSAPTTAGRSGSTAPARVAARDVRYLLARSYTVDYQVASTTADGRRLLVFHSICTGSADGHCQAIDVFRGSGERPIWHRQYIGVLAIRAAPGGFSVRAASYAPQDPLCCPSLPPVIDVYTWTEAGLHEAGPLPKSPTS